MPPTSESSPTNPGAGPAVVRLIDVPHWRDRIGDLDPIFFEASLTKCFPDGEARRAFRERWLGRFLCHWPALAHVAVEADPVSSPDAKLIGYIVGAHVDPACDPRFSDIGFYKHLARLTPTYPAHLHINLAPQARNRGVGSRLIAAFEQDARDAGLVGAHLVTGRDSRNRSFYARNGFAQVTELSWGGTPIVMLAKSFA
ncbi:MAG: GNAT family N-acetyltransferase [Hyphomicrobiaceae bacterium]